MGIGIQICGLNGCGKSTLGKALAERIGLHFIDNEHLYFSRPNADKPYANPKSRAEVERLLMDEVNEYPDFVFSAVKGDYGKDIVPMYNYVVVIDVPKEIRTQRVRNRSFQKFEDRMLIGGDLYGQEEAFFEMAAGRGLDMHHCPPWAMIIVATGGASLAYPTSCARRPHNPEAESAIPRGEIRKKAIPVGMTFSFLARSTEKDIGKLNFKPVSQKIHPIVRWILFKFLAYRNNTKRIIS